MPLLSIGMQTRSDPDLILTCRDLILTCRDLILTCRDLFPDPSPETIGSALLP